MSMQTTGSHLDTLAVAPLIRTRMYGVLTSAFDRHVALGRQLADGTVSHLLYMTRMYSILTSAVDPHAALGRHLVHGTVSRLLYSSG